MEELDSIVHRVQAGERAVVRELADALGPPLLRLYLIAGLSLADAEALAVSSVGDIVLKLDRFEHRGPGSFRRWAFQVATNALRDQRRRRHPRLLTDAEEVALPDPEPAWEEPTDLVEAVRQAVGELSEPDRTIVLARMEDPERTFEEIGTEVGLTGGAARVRHHRALEKLEQSLEARPAVQAWRNSLRLPPDPKGANRE